MFATWKAPLEKHAKAIGQRAGGLRFRVAVAVALTLLHVVMFVWAGHVKLNLPFNSAPGQAPYYTDINFPSVRGMKRQPHHWSRLLVSRWDSEHYIGYALRGLKSCPHSPPHDIYGDNAFLQCGLSWLPAWGEFGGVVSRATGAPADYTLMILSMLAAMVLNLLWTSKPVVSRIGLGESYAALLAFNIFPTGFFLVTPYSEAMTLMLGLAGLLCFFERRWIWAGILIGAQTALRATAIGYALGLSAGVAVAAWRQRKAGEAKWWKPLIAIPLSGWGLAVESVVLQITVGDWRAYLRAQKAFYGPGRPANPWKLLDPTFFLHGFGMQQMDFVVLFGLLALTLVTAREVLKKFKLEEAVALVITSFVVVLVPLITIRDYWSFTRYLLMAPLAFMCVGSLSRKHTALFVAWLVLCAIFYWHIELCSYIAHGDPRICPCLGREEFTMPFAS